MRRRRQPIHAHGFWMGDVSTDYGFDTDLCKALCSRLQNRSVVDFGCGDGRYVDAMKLAGIDATGFDGHPNTSEITHGVCGTLDLASPFDLNRQWDVVLCLEVLEHIPAQFERIALENITKACHQTLIVSWATPGQRGLGHFNEKSREDVEGALVDLDFKVDKFLSNSLRERATIAWFKNNVLVFRRASIPVPIHVLIVNINGLQYTLPLLDDLCAQTHLFDLTVIDQGSTEEGTREALSKVGNVIYNPDNRPLNYLWNEHTAASPHPYMCFLNNDLRIPNNFIADTVNILEQEATVGAVIHATNHPDFTQSKDLVYKILPPGYRQGHDFTIRKNAYIPIPPDLKTFGGDDWLFTKLQETDWKVAAALSSPIIHFHARSRKFYTGSRAEEGKAIVQHGLPKLRSPWCSYRRPIIKDNIMEPTGIHKLICTEFMIEPGSNNLPKTGGYAGRNCTRETLAKLFGQLGYKRGVEVGTAQGLYAERLCKNNLGLKLISVDPQHTRQAALRYREAIKRLAPYDVEFMRMKSMDAVGKFPDSSLDFVYIDARHEFDQVIMDIIHWVPKVRIGGIVSGHDFIHHQYDGVIFTGAVEAYTKAHHIDPWYLTGFSDDTQSWFWVREA